MRDRITNKGPLPWLAGLIVVYLAVPVIAFAVRLSFARQRGFHSPGLFPSLWVSVETATISLALISLFGIPLAYLLARSHGRIASIVGLVVQLPLALPPLMSGFLLVELVGPYTFLGRLLHQRLTMSLTGVVLAQTFVAAPFLIVASRASFSAVDPTLLEVAATLGHSEPSRFRRVALPMAAPGVRAGMLLAWLRAFGEYGATVVLAYHPFSLPIYTYNQFSGSGLPNTAAPTALALAVAVVAVMLSRLRWGRRPKPTALPRARGPGPVTPSPIGFTVDHRMGTFHLALDHQPTGNRLAVLGASGSGKSTLLRCLAGLCGPLPGPVTFGHRRVEQVRVERRRVGYVAQGFSLFPLLTVWQNLLFAPDATEELAAYWLVDLGLEGLEDRVPSQLSNGQRQRAGLAQALCHAPDLLLLDEPFSALDAPVRNQFRRTLRRLQRQTGLATVLVTHDPEEAAQLADDLMVIAEGSLLQSGTTRQLFSRPSSSEVAHLLGIPNLHRAVVVSGGIMVTGGATLDTDTIELEPGTSVWWTIRPEDIRLSPAGNLSGTLADIADTGTATELVVSIAPSLQLEARLPNQVELDIGQVCHLDLPRQAIAVWPATESEA